MSTGQQALRRRFQQQPRLRACGQHRGKMTAGQSWYPEQVKIFTSRTSALHPARLVGNSRPGWPP